MAGLWSSKPVTDKSLWAKGFDKMAKLALIIGLFIAASLPSFADVRLRFSRCGEFKGQDVFISWLSPGGEGGANILIGDDKNNPSYRVNGLDWGKKPFENPVTETASGSEKLRCGDDVMIFSEYVSVRHGNNLDLFTFITKRDGDFIDLDARLEDGDQHGVTNNPRGPLIVLGKNKDVWLQYCFGDIRWTSSEVHRGDNPNAGLTCGDDAVVFFNGVSVQYDPHRIPSAPVNKYTPIAWRGLVKYATSEGLIKFTAYQSQKS